jgi:cyclopropane fatty-acyl-phospholipid synthase-like methyltransferase
MIDEPNTEDVHNNHGDNVEEDNNYVFYNKQNVDFMVAVYGEEYLSPGGQAEVAGVLSGIDLKGKRVLDIGCRLGAITLSLTIEYGASEVVGINVEDTVCQSAKKRVTKAGEASRVYIQKVVPGSLQFGDKSFDVVFSVGSCSFDVVGLGITNGMGCVGIGDLG